VSIKAGSVCSSLTVIVTGGVTSSGYTYGGAAGTVYVVNGTISTLILPADSKNGGSSMMVYPRILFLRNIHTNSSGSPLKRARRRVHVPLGTIT
jgi:hypothetical protein